MRFLVVLVVVLLVAGFLGQVGPWELLIAVCFAAGVVAGSKRLQH